MCNLNDRRKTNNCVLAQSFFFLSSNHSNTILQTIYLIDNCLPTDWNLPNLFKILYFDVFCVLETSLHTVHPIKKQNTSFFFSLSEANQTKLLLSSVRMTQNYFYLINASMRREICWVWGFLPNGSLEL